MGSASLVLRELLEAWLAYTCWRSPHGSVAGARLVRGPWADGLAAELLWRHVSYGLGQLPAVAGEIHKGAVPLAVLSVDWRFDDDGAMVSARANASATSATRTRTTCVTPPDSGARRSPPTSAMITAPSDPTAIWAR